MTRKVIENPNNCSLVHAINIIGGKWKLIIIYQLSSGSLRFGKLLYLIPSISRKVLTEQLRELEAEQLLIRKKYNEIPPRVEYSLSNKSKNLLPFIKGLSNWSELSFPEKDFAPCTIKSNLYTFFSLLLYLSLIGAYTF